jgi:hypothetical protein
MPAQQRPRGDQARAARWAWQVARRRRKKGTIRGTKVRPRHLAAQDLELVAQDEQLDVLDVQPAATTDERSQQRPERAEDQREGQRSPIFPTRPAKSATRVLAPFTLLAGGSASDW